MTVSTPNRGLKTNMFGVFEVTSEFDQIYNQPKVRFVRETSSIEEAMAEASELNRHSVDMSYVALEYKVSSYEVRRWGVKL